MHPGNSRLWLVGTKSVAATFGNKMHVQMQNNAKNFLSSRTG